MTPDEYCQDQAAKSGSSFYYSFLFLTPPKRQAITALYAFCREVDDVVDECSDPGLARNKLNWWRQELDRTFAGQAEHPVGLALQDALRGFELRKELLGEIIDGMEMDLDRHSYASFAELETYCYRVASVVGLLAAEIFGYRDPATLDYARELGMAFQLTNILRDVREDAIRGRCYLPADEMQRYGVRPDDLNQPSTSDELVKLLAFQAERAHAYYERAFSALPEADRYSQRSGLIMAAIYQTTLREIERDGFRILEQRVRLTPLRKLWIAWRSARAEKRRQRRFLRESA